MTTLLAVNNLQIKRKGDLVLDGASFTVDAHQITGITGPNGGGKSSLFEAIMGFLPLSGGTISWSSSVQLAYLKQQVLPRKMVPLSVKDFVSTGTWGPRQNSQPAVTITEALKVFEIDSIANRLVNEISGGQWRRALLARCLVQPADVYLLDEPFNQIDIQMENCIGHLLKDLVRTKQKSFIVISHDWHAMDHFFDKLLFLNQKVLASGSVREIGEKVMNWKNPQHHEWMHSGEGRHEL